MVQIFVRGQSSSVGGVIKLLARQSLAGPATGLAFGLCGTIWLYLAETDANIWSVILLVAAFGSYYVSEDGFKSSGTLATVALGMMMTVVSHKWVKLNLKAVVDPVW